MGPGEGGMKMTDLNVTANANQHCRSHIRGIKARIPGQDTRRIERPGFWRLIKR